VTVATATGRSKVAKWGHSLAVRIPQEAAREMGLVEGSEVSVSVKGQSMTIRRARPVVTLDELLDGVTPENAGGEVDSGPPVGREVW
jgi:antitoxin MazE